MEGTYEGTKRSSILTYLASSSIALSPSSVGSAILDDERLRRAKFLSGRNSRTLPFLSLYAFVPSKQVKA